ncbi:hypothetical protein GGR42_002635 [Saonia flava]|uniref:Monoheme cytochrome C n=1 Tax=Saonia flava TaxID=523696 RepID=A0A846R460_9FLAO|nr:monoheme cytochrome C [Saonia flava]NJB72144.1 hypothetical protein [Saonia flava]
MGTNKNIKSKLLNLVVIVSLLLGGIYYFVTREGAPKVMDAEEVVDVNGLEEDLDKIENGIHVRTGFVDAEGLDQVVQNCTTCHSAKLVTQNRMSKEQWQATIRWMQETQNLWPLGENEELIVNYLATHYAPDKKGRRQNLANVEWYTLNDK